MVVEIIIAAAAALGTLAGITLVVLVWLDRLGLVDVEWNPFSDVARAARAERVGAFVDALGLYQRSRHADRLIECLERNLPESSLRRALVDASREVLDLQQHLSALRASTSPELAILVDDLSHFVASTAEVLWNTADRLRVATALTGPSGGLTSGFERERETLTHLIDAIRQFRAALADVVLAGGEPEALRSAATRTTALAEGLRSLLERHD